MALWLMIGGIAGLARIAIGAGLAWIACVLFVVPWERADARAGYVLEATATAAIAERDAIREQLTRNTNTIEAYRASYEAVVLANDEIEKRAEKDAIEYSKNRSCPATSRADIEFLRKR